jgi:glycosyltransferase involved in cell wall biosynthesis
MLIERMSTVYNRIMAPDSKPAKGAAEPGSPDTLSLSSLFLAMPLLSPLRDAMARERDKRAAFIRRRPESEKTGTTKRILWFTDTINDLNGPSVTLKKLGWLAHRKGLGVNLVCSLLDEEITAELPPNYVNLPFLFSFKLPFYNKYTMKVPAFIRALKLIKSFEPTDIYISTPGPMGLFALLAANILGVKKVGIYHTDFYLQSKAVINSELLARIIERGVKWFYSSMDEIHVPTVEYMDILEAREYDRSKMKIFRRGIDSLQFSGRDSGKSLLIEKFGIRDGVTLLFTGRMSPDKNIDFLLDVYKKLVHKRENINLLLVGDGPYINDIRHKMREYRRVVLTGRLEQELLPEIYSGSDIFVFPSIADTFGMSVLEAQACGLPAVVSDAGGPKEIVLNGSTGFVARANDLHDWTEKLERVIELMEHDFESYVELKNKSRQHIIENYDWDSVLGELMGNEDPYSGRRTHIA